ncbi:flavin reductase family protein [Pseudonocardia sp. HH130630-07]|uniref:flavin reductase family protein n=1 Tax=Pseudonocardia sp. HH130630-07 TaxID=1690815 RepID=UPI000814CC30|nr:flavin reductase family protein [Pseudonocardia sp. HH130630-07]ANY09456.1 oxidoreductase [Pseudonocardia sp. HH130630-07]
MSELIPTITGGAGGTVDTAGLRQVFGRFPSGVTAVCALDDDRVPVGLAASSFVAVSLDPPLVGLCVQHTSTTWPRLRDRARLGLSVLGDGQDRICRQLASKQGDRFAGLDLHRTADGAVLLGGASAWLDCSVESAVTAGDHDLVLLRVHRQCTHPGRGPLVFHESGFHALASLGAAS